MIRKIIHIDEEKCIDIVDGKAKLMRENFCDGFGDCLPNCPTGAITFEEREAPAYDEAAVKKSQEAKKMEEMKLMHHEGGCPGSRMMQFEQKESENTPVVAGKPISRIAQWPCQIKLVPTQAPFFDGAKLLIAADCTAYKGNCSRWTIWQTVTKAVAEIFPHQFCLAVYDIKSVTIVRMEVPCCGGLQRAAEIALRNSGKFIPWQVVTISRDGHILD